MEPKAEQLPSWDVLEAEVEPGKRQAECHGRSVTGGVSRAECHGLVSNLLDARAPECARLCTELNIAV